MTRSSPTRKPYIIACAVLALDIKAVAEKLGIDVGVRYLEGGLHERPHLLREKLQAAVDEISASGRCDRIMIGYGVCGRGTVGIQAREIPLAIPKVHDCIALFLGGDRAYQREFEKYPGTYYISSGWYEEKTEPFSQHKKSVHLGDQKLSYDQLVEKYGEKDATWIMDQQYQHYERVAFVAHNQEDLEKYRPQAQEVAEYCQRWDMRYEEIIGSDIYVRRLIEMAASNEVESNTDFLVIPPGGEVTQEMFMR